MSIKVNVTPDITSFKEKIAMNMSLRQLVSLGVAFMVGFFIYGKLNVNPAIRRAISLSLITPILLIGFIKYQGVIYFEEYLYFLLRKFFCLQVRIYTPEIDVVKEIRDISGGHSNGTNVRKTNNGVHKKRKKGQSFQG